MTNKVRWKTLPIKANQDMEKAGAEAAREYLERTGSNSLFAIYEAMAAAAPKLPASTEPVGAPAERDERADFEAYAIDKGWLVHQLKQRPDGNYEDWGVNPEWQAWKARAALE